MQTQPKLNEESARFHILDTRASHEKPFALLVRGFAPTTTRRTIELFFDNERASGGNNVEDVEFDGKLMTAVVSFRDEGGTYFEEYLFWCKRPKCQTLVTCSHQHT